MKRLTSLFMAFVACQIAATQTGEVLTCTDAPGCGALIVRALDPVAALPLMHWIQPCHPAWRRETLRRDNRAYANELFPSQRYNALVFLGGDGHKDAVAARTFRGPIDARDARHFLLQVSRPPIQHAWLMDWRKKAHGKHTM
jgi:hypothetical protein